MKRLTNRRHRAVPSFAALCALSLLSCSGDLGSVNVANTQSSSSTSNTVVSSSLFSQQGNPLVGNGASDPANQGSALALSTDGNTAMIGAPKDASNFGATWAFTRSSGQWSQQGNKIVSSTASGSGPLLGTSVALSGDGNTSLIGGPNDSSGSTRGAGWIFSRTSGTWTETKKLTFTSAVIHVPIGTSVALDANANTAVLGSPNNGTGVDYDFWIWQKPNSAFNFQRQGTAGAQLGTSVSMSADGTTAVIGAPFDNTQGTSAGMAWVLNGSTWWSSTPQTLVVNPPTPGAQFGTAVSISADGTTALVGGPFDNSSVGSAWVFVLSSGTWTQQAKLNASDPVGSAKFGSAVALSGNGNVAIIGGPGDNSGSGAAWAFTRTNGVWTQAQKLIGNPAIGAAAQGSAVAITPDGTTVLVGGPNNNSGAGATWVFTSSSQ